MSAGFSSLPQAGSAGRSGTLGLPQAPARNAGSASGGGPEDGTGIDPTALASATGLDPSLLPSGQAGVGQTGAAQTGAAQPGATDPAQAGAAGQVAPSAVPDLGGMMEKVKWLGPLMAIGGSVLLGMGFKNDVGWQKMMGGGMAASGLLTTIMGFQAAGKNSATKETTKNAEFLISEIQKEAKGVIDKQQATLLQIAQASDARDKELAALKQQLGVDQGNAGQGTVPGQTGQIPGQQQQQPDPNGQTGQVPGQNTPQVPGQNTPQTPGPGGQTPQTGQTPGSTTPAQPQTAPVLQAGTWSPAALIGSAVTLTAAMTAGIPTAEAGRFALQSQLGSTTGYATYDEADAAARSAVQDVMGTERFRWLVVQHEDKYYSYTAMLDGGGSPEMPAANGTVVGWHALKAISQNNTVAWTQTDWSATAGTKTVALEYANGHIVLPTTTASTQVPVGNTPGTQVDNATGGGKTSSIKSQLGKGFSIPTVGTSQGGHLQVQTIVGNVSFSTAADAAVAARQARGAAPNDQWKRWLVVQGSDNRFYAVQGSLVARPVPQLDTGNLPVFIFGKAFGEYFDGTSWRSQAE